MIKIEILSKQIPDLEIVTQLFQEYARELDENICFQNFDDEVKNPLLKYGGDKGLLLIAKWNDSIVGCVAYTKLEEAYTCEMKRLYVKPEYRDKKIGIALALAIIEHAKQNGYKKMVLDTLEKLKSAIAVYEKLGFKKTDPYYNNPLSGVIYMEKSLND